MAAGRNRRNSRGRRRVPALSGFRLSRSARFLWRTLCRIEDRSCLGGRVVKRAERPLVRRKSPFRLSKSMQVSAFDRRDAGLTDTPNADAVQNPAAIWP